MQWLSTCQSFSSGCRIFMNSANAWNLCYCPVENSISCPAWFSPQHISKFQLTKSDMTPLWYGRAPVSRSSVHFNRWDDPMGAPQVWVWTGPCLGPPISDLVGDREGWTLTRGTPFVILLNKGDGAGISPLIISYEFIYDVELCLKSLPTHYILHFIHSLSFLCECVHCESEMYTLYSMCHFLNFHSFVPAARWLPGLLTAAQ